MVRGGSGTDIGDTDDSVDLIMVTVAYGERSVIDTPAAADYRCMLIDLHWTATGIAAETRTPTFNEPLPTCSP
ncbi:MAG: hypothetical protein F4Y05_08620 [Acidimicrobiaceae bacterium]|nr:hypothetical protein [Acidimicrobiaceae bacterium]MYE09654.1 hypothetical protein [Acidimicrobiaceae bacterium]MYI36063.1 hypothetical protein [Acidimicrobiaceae bacterium]